MTIGQLARRSGVSTRALREYEGLGLIYGLGRSGSNCRLFDASALWCLQVIRSLRSLGPVSDAFEVGCRAWSTLREGASALDSR
ncbi:MAG: MerR family transcriptional regulator [Chloroflexi bacterium]|nr:MAG: MerR family transcriptional regulator [Chloroflexota bacterium]